tara:strand:+ start:331 stop:780 length:450 start_codon:yes stop_codon:yes gene_type:complete
MNKEQKNAKREYLERIEGQTLDECRSLLRKGLWTEGELDELARGLQKISDRTAIRRLKKENGEPLDEKIQAVEEISEVKGLKYEFFYLVEYLDSYDRPTQDVLLYLGSGKFFGAWWNEDDEDDANAACDIYVDVCDVISIWGIKRGRER